MPSCIFSVWLQNVSFALVNCESSVCVLVMKLVSGYSQGFTKQFTTVITVFYV